MEELTKSQARMQAINKTREFNRKNYPNVKYISPSQALALFNLSKIILIDVNTQNYFFKEKHITNAINIPIDKISHVRINLPKKKLIGVYCQ
jgi:rhodanese-related sulfurtransferase